MSDPAGGGRLVILNFLIRSASLSSSVLLIFGVTTQLSLDEQGVYYLLQSLVALTFFFDLGIGFVLANMAGSANARSTNAGERHSTSPSAVAHFGLKWSLIAGSAFSVIVGTIGSFEISRVSGPAFAPLALWWLLAITSGGNLLLGAGLSFFEGMGHAHAASVIRFAQAFSNALAFLVIVSASGSPFAVGMSTALSVILAMMLFTRKFGNQLRRFWQMADARALVWRRDVLPFQWRVAISWLTGYFMFQAPTLVLATHGVLSQAGQFGLSMQIFLAIISVAQVYLTFCVPRWSSKMAAGTGPGILKDYHRAIIITNAIVIAAGCSIIAVISHLLPQNLTIRVLDTSMLLRILAGTCGFQIFMCGNFYFRAQLREALWPVSVFGAAIMVIGAVAFWNKPDAAVATNLYMCIGLTVGILSIAIVRRQDFAWRMRGTTTGEG